MASKTFTAEDRARVRLEALNLQKSLEDRAEVASVLCEGLCTLHGVQMVVSSLVEGCIPETGEKATPDQLRTYFLALNVELMELLQELSWKPWKNTKQIDEARVADEFADVLAFLGIIVVYLDSLGVPPSVLASAYAIKSRVNVERLLGKVAGYDNPTGR